MATLIYSNRCKHSVDLLRFISENSEVRDTIQMHNVDTEGAPMGVTHVPTLVTQDKVYIGGDALGWLKEQCASTVPAASGDGMSFIDLDGKQDISQPGGPSNLMDLGTPLAAPMTEEHRKKMAQKVA